MSQNKTVIRLDGFQRGERVAIDITIDHDELARYISKKLASPGKGGKRRTRLTRCEGGIVARVPG